MIANLTAVEEAKKEAVVVEQPKPVSTYDAMMEEQRRKAEEIKKKGVCKYMCIYSI